MGARKAQKDVRCVGMEPFLSIEKMKLFIEQAIQHYQHAPGWFTSWLDTLYIRLSDDWRTITLDELCELARLHDEDGWKPEPFAVNAVYKLFDRLGRDTTGIIGY